MKPTVDLKPLTLLLFCAVGLLFWLLFGYFVLEVLT